jgi:hypothetical protein
MNPTEALKEAPAGRFEIDGWCSGVSFEDALTMVPAIRGRFASPER